MPALPNARHERFAQGLAKGLPAIKAYEEAGYKPDTGAASRLSGNVSIAERVAEITERGATRAEITLAGVTEALMRIAKTAEDLGEASGLAVARAAHMDAAKINGLIVERTENVNVNHVVSDEPPTEAEWQEQHATAH